MKRFGVNVRRVRLSGHLTLKELSSLSGVSQAMLSDIERGMKIPTIEIACKIADALKVSILTLLEKEDNRVYITRMNERPILAAETEMTRFLLSPSLPFSPIEFEFCILPYGKRSGIIKSHQPPIKEYLVVVSGKLELLISETDKYILEEGDSVAYQICSDHQLKNVGEGDVSFYYISEVKNKL